MANSNRKSRKGFTVVELMVVTLIIAVLMAIAFKITNIGDEADRRNRTIARLQRLENCLSGYYAVYGSYPPVPMQGVSRNINVTVNDYGVQDDGTLNNSLNWGQVRAACLAQPVAAVYPYPEAMNEYIDQLSDLMKERWGSDDDPAVAAKFSRGFQNASKNANGLFGASVQTTGSDFRGKAKRLSPNWNDCQLFRYGLMSFLLPRYLFMMGGDPSFYKGTDTDPQYFQWGGFNKRPANIINGKRNDPRSNEITSFDTLRSMIGYDARGNISGNSRQRAEVEAIPSQSVCRRWLTNLEGIVAGGHTFYGVNTHDPLIGNALNVENKGIHLYESNGQQYVLGEMTVYDGWYNTVYYYSEPPYQSYRLWSAGANGRTFPPWIPLDSLNQADRRTASAWIDDDIIMMSN